MPKFRALFSFHEKEIALFFTRASFIAQIPGLKMLGERSSTPELAAPHGKLLIVTSRKMGKACVRNRVRRQLRAAFYERGLSAIPFRVAIICYSQAVDLTYAQIDAFLVNALKRYLPPQS
jgi:ribonuclease P protein component